MKTTSRCCLATLTLLFMSSVANADLILYLDATNSTATLVGSATADEVAVAFQGTGVRFGGPGASSSALGVFGTESDSVVHDKIVQFNGGGIGFTAGADSTADADTILTGSGLAVDLSGSIGFFNTLLLRDGDVYTGLNSTDTLTVAIAAVPEPTGLALCGMGLFVCSLRRRRRLKLR